MSAGFGPWIGVAVGCLLALTGARWTLRPNAFVGAGLIRATDPRTVRLFGIVIGLFGLLDAAINLSRVVSE